MPRAILLLGLLASRYCPGADAPAPRDAPSYTAAGIVNAADNVSGALAPNTIGTIYGSNLAYSTVGITPCGTQVCSLPTLLGTEETSVIINYSYAALFYVSPNQINFLVPPLTNLIPGPKTIYVDVDGLHGPIVELTLATTAPALFQLDARNAVATLVDGSVLTPLSPPVKPGDIVVLWASGLGDTTPSADGFELPTVAAPLVAGANLQVLLNGAAVSSDAIGYAGVAPGNAGLYQINLTLPMSIGTSPQIQLAMTGGAPSISGLYLALGQ